MGWGGAGSQSRASVTPNPPQGLSLGRAGILPPRGCPNPTEMGPNLDFFFCHLGEDGEVTPNPAPSPPQGWDPLELPCWCFPKRRIPRIYPGFTQIPLALVGSGWVWDFSRPSHWIHGISWSWPLAGATAPPPSHPPKTPGGSPNSDSAPPQSGFRTFSVVLISSFIF